MAGLDKVDPANPCFLCCAGRACAWAVPVERARSLIEKCPRALDEGFLVLEQYGLRRRTAGVGKVRVLTS
jgi:hypothetical protein